MQEIRRYEADIDYCPSCKGIWLDRGEIDKIAMAQNRIDEEHHRRYHRDRDYDDYDDDYYNYGGHRRRRGFLGDLFDFDYTMTKASKYEKRGAGSSEKD